MFLQPIAYSTGQSIYTEGWVDRGAEEDSGIGGSPVPPPIPGVTIIVTGECRANVEIQKSSAVSKSLGTDNFHSLSFTSQKKGKVTRADLGRIGPGGVLYHFNAQDPEDEDAFHTESVTAATPVHAYTISRSDFFFRLDSNCREAVQREIARDVGALRTVTTEEWRKSEAWTDFKKATSIGEKKKMENKNRSIIDSYRSLQGVTFTSTCQVPMPSHRRPTSPLKSGDGSHTNSHGFVRQAKGTDLRGVTMQMFGGEFDEDIAYIKRSLGTAKSALPSDHCSRASPSNTPVWPTDMDSDVASSLRTMTGSRADRGEVQDAIIRNRRRVGPKKHRLAFLQNRSASLPQSPPLSCAPSSLGPDVVGDESVVQEEETDWTKAYHEPHSHALRRNQSRCSVRGKDRHGDPSPVLPFSLIHIHREIIASPVGAKDSHEVRNKGDDAAGTDLEVLGGRRKRPLRCHIRLCGTMRSPEAARESAEAQVEQAMLQACKGAREDDEAQGVRITWRKFSGFEAIPSQHIDHFIGA